MRSYSLCAGSVRVLILGLLACSPVLAQKAKTPASPVASGLTTAVHVQILRAEDERRWDAALEALLKSPVAAIRKRAALAAGRIGNEAAVPALSHLLDGDSDQEVRAMAAFALGETESGKAAEAVLKPVLNEKDDAGVRARAIEAAGKIGAADKVAAAALGEGILDALELEADNPKQNKQFILLGLTAVMRVRPEESDFITAKFLNNLDADIRVYAGNTMARLRGKNANETLRAMLMSDDDAVARANAARSLGAAEDKLAFDILLEAATGDEDQRVRVSAIRALGSLKDVKATDKLIEHGQTLLNSAKNSKLKNPAEKNELLEIATVLGRLMAKTNDVNSLKFLQEIRERDGFGSPETEIAFARIAPEKYIAEFNAKNKGISDWRVASAYSQGLGSLAAADNPAQNMAAGKALTAYVNFMAIAVKPAQQAEMLKAMPDIMNAMTALKPDNLNELLLNLLKNSDVYIRAAAAGNLADLSASKENIDALKSAFSMALITDNQSDDAQLAIMDALFKLDKKESVGVLLAALNAPDFLLRKKAFELLKTPGLDKDFPGLPSSLDAALKDKDDQVKTYTPVFGTKLGQVLNTAADYTRAASRKNGSIKAVLTTEKGIFTIELMPEDAPLTVDNFVKLARANYFNGLMVHRVVPNFVMQDGDPRGDGNGGPGWSIRCEMNMAPFERGAVGMALSGKDTGGSQWFAAHSVQPHLDGGYTVFGRVSEADMKVVDNIARGDRIISVKIVETAGSQVRSKELPKNKQR